VQPLPRSREEQEILDNLVSELSVLRALCSGPQQCLVHFLGAGRVGDTVYVLMQLYKVGLPVYCWRCRQTGVCLGRLAVSFTAGT
jgi:hypothetical protein